MAARVGLGALAELYRQTPRLVTAYFFKIPPSWWGMCQSGRECYDDNDMIGSVVLHVFRMRRDVWIIHKSKGRPSDSCKSSLKGTWLIPWLCDNPKRTLLKEERHLKRETLTQGHFLKDHHCLSGWSATSLTRQRRQAGLATTWTPKPSCTPGSHWPVYP